MTTHRELFTANLSSRRNTRGLAFSRPLHLFSITELPNQVSLASHRMPPHLSLGLFRGNKINCPTFVADEQNLVILLYSGKTDQAFI